MDRDRKSPGLKVLQGLIWDEGYRRGDLHGVVFDTVVPAMRRCRAAGKRIAIYSSGSVLAQKLLFSTTPDGNLTTMIDGFFDTGVGAKVEPASYSRIASLLGVAPGEILFLTDATAEVTAARAAGVQAVIVTSPSVFETISGV
jgi:enolase-phosphatase E1